MNSNQPENTATRAPIFPLPGALLLPGGDLPLNIFEPRYIAMVRAAMAGDRLIGMIQPCPEPCVQKMPQATQPFFHVGCLGRIAAFEEVDGRFLITLHGLVRFHLTAHHLHDDGYRIGVLDSAAFIDDLREPEALPECLTRPSLLEKLHPYLAKEGLYVDWSLAENIPDARFYTLLAMVCPFDALEKQALLEAPNFEERCRLLKTLLALSCASAPSQCPERPC